MQLKEKKGLGTSLVVQWLKLLAAMQGAKVRSLVGELRSYIQPKITIINFFLINGCIFLNVNYIPVKKSQKDMAVLIQTGNSNTPPCPALGCSMMSECLQSHGLYPARLLCLWHLPGKNTGVGCRFHLQGIFLTQ